MGRKTILAVILAAFVLFAYQFYIARYYPDTYSGRPAATQPTYEQQPDMAVAAAALSADTNVESTIPGREVKIGTEKYIVTLNNEGGCIKSIALKEYPQPGTNELFQLVSVDKPEEGIFNMTGLGQYNLPHARYDTIEKSNEVIFSLRTPAGLEITKKYIFHNTPYYIELELYFYNSSDMALPSDYSIVASSNIYIANKIDRRDTQIVSEISGKARRDNGKKGEGLFVTGIATYSGLQNKYFSVITKPSIATKGVWFRQIDNDNLLSKIEIDKFIIQPNSTVSHSFLLYAGPNKKEIMKPYHIDSAVSYGFFGGISDMLLASLALFQRIFKNWGIAIILLSLFVNLILFPLSRKSYQSMKKMQELQPHMEKLKNEHKDNPQKLNKEMMGLYKKYNVNPMGGCLPMLLQIPVFVALYQALMRSLDLRGAKFLWIKDLSMPDAVHIPFSIPAVGNSINLLPILMSLAMVFQQKMATSKSNGTSAQAKQQQQMMIMMPVLFLFIMYNFPSGLVLYWLVNTLLTMFEQRAIMYS